MIFKVSNIIFFACFLLFIPGCMKTSEVFQQDADIVRLKHLEYYGELIEKYYEKVEKYPFSDRENVPVYVFIANDEQIDFTKKGPNYKHVVIAFSELVNEIESVLGREINEYYDPQYRPDYKPNFYIYMVNQGTYFFAIHVHQPFPFAKKVTGHYHKIEISNHPTFNNQAHAPQTLFNSFEFQKELSKTINKEAFFKEREEKYIHFTKKTSKSTIEQLK